MPDKKVVNWSPTAQAELRAIDRETAMRILAAIDHYLGTGSGDIIKLQPPRAEFRLRVGDYRVLFLRLAPLSIEILRVRHRSQAYR
ncbi:MAG: type II toxin-antitoxin system RelE/ParE family toxin [Acidobacteria bacterium]|nr:type II toxin-antitoxin system RelE/ParE family toxin [Acidobacteriota bacterium]